MASRPPAAPKKLASKPKMAALRSRRTPAVVRGPHAERTAAMRKRLIDAAIDCLCEHGYAATTLQSVTDVAGVSRGAILHHFPNKVDLMIAVAEHAAGKQNRLVARLLADTKPGMDRYNGDHHGDLGRHDQATLDRADRDHDGLAF